MIVPVRISVLRGPYTTPLGFLLINLPNGNTETIREALDGITVVSHNHNRYRVFSRNPEERIIVVETIPFEVEVVLDEEE